MTAAPEPGHDADAGEDADATELVDRTIRIDRGARRPVVPDTDEHTRVSRRRAGADGVDVGVGGEDDAGETAVAERRRRPAASDSTPPILRAAYAPDADALRTGYVPRTVPAAPFERTASPPRRAQAPSDTQEVARSVRARAQRRLVWVAVGVAATLVVAIALLVALIASFAG